MKRKITAALLLSLGLLSMQGNLHMNEKGQLTTPTTSFDPLNYTQSEVELGDFPYIKAPENSYYINNVKVKNFDANVFVTNDTIFEVEGKVFRAWVQKERGFTEEISNRYLLKKFEEQIIAKGGVKIFDGELIGERLKQYNSMVNYKGADGSFIPSHGSSIVTYFIRHKTGNIYICLEKCSRNATSFQIVQEELSN